MVHFISVPVRWQTHVLHAVQFALLATSLLAALTAHSQPTAKLARPDPLDPNASVPALGYVSPLSNYRRLSDAKVVSWRDANDTVTRIGGWRVYAREAQQPDAAVPAVKPARPASAPNSNEMVKPMPAGHGDHPMP